ncbi:MAG: LytTR family transcriptional regulator, partial [bacterium]|nr:LytTR family transcriptional regulator [bacterium]
RFEQALDRARQGLGKQPLPAATLASAARAPNAYLERIAVKRGSSVFVLATAKLDYIEAQEDYVALKTEGKTFLKQQTISSLEKSLDPKRFIRIHRSYIVNIDRLARIEPYSKDSRIAVLSNGDQLPVSRGGFARLKDHWGQVS